MIQNGLQELLLKIAEISSKGGKEKLDSKNGKGSGKEKGNSKNGNGKVKEKRKLQKWKRKRKMKSKNGKGKGKWAQCSIYSNNSKGKEKGNNSNKWKKTWWKNNSNSGKSDYVKFSPEQVFEKYMHEASKWGSTMQYAKAYHTF